MTHLRLQKLLYYVQGWALAIRGEPAFGDRIEAWEHGPVVPSVYQRLKDLGKAAIPASRLSAPPLDPELHSFVASVWEDLRALSAIELRERTHQEAPWQEAWGRRQLPTHGHEEITSAALRAYFGGRSGGVLSKFKIRKPPTSWLDEDSPFPTRRAE